MSSLVQFGATLSNNTTGSGANATVKLGGAAAGDTNCAQAVTTANHDVSVHRILRLTCAASDVLLMQYKINGIGTARFFEPDIAVTPVRHTP